MDVCYQTYLQDILLTINIWIIPESRRNIFQRNEHSDNSEKSDLVTLYKFQKIDDKDLGGTFYISPLRFKKQGITNVHVAIAKELFELRYFSSHSL